MLFILLLCIALLIIIIYLWQKEHSIKEDISSDPYKPYTYKTWYQCKNGDKVNKLFQNILINNNLERTYGQDWDIYFPCNSDYSEKGFVKIKPSNKNQVVSYISRNGILGSKENIWKMLNKYYGRNDASTIMPRSYIFPNDKSIFAKEYLSTKHYIMKTEAQRQTGLKLSNNFDEIINSRDNGGYKIVQEYVDNPLLYKGYKLNFRIYLLVVCCGKNKEGYIFYDGIISYSKKRYHGPISFDKGVASFYTSKQLYDNGFPITFKELQKHMTDINWESIVSKFKNLLVKVLNATNSSLCVHKLPYNNKTFQLFGVDFMITNKGDQLTSHAKRERELTPHIKRERLLSERELTPYIIEINIGPGMDPYCDKDKELRTKLHNDLLSVTGIIPKTSHNNFIKIWGSS